MATNYVQKGEVMDYVASATLTSGTPVLVGDILGVPLVDAVSGDTLAVQIEGVFDIAATAADTFVQGQILFWDDSTKKLTETAGSNKPVAIAMETKAADVTTVAAKLHPMVKDTDT